MEVMLFARTPLAPHFQLFTLTFPPPPPQVIRDALSDSMEVVLLAGTQSDTPDEVAQSALRQLGPDAGSRVRVFSCARATGAWWVGDGGDCSVSQGGLQQGGAAC